MELGKFYNLDECVDRDYIISHLDILYNEGKIDYSIDYDILEITDLDLEDSDIENLLDIFADNEIYPDENDISEDSDLDLFSDDYEY